MQDRSLLVVPESMRRSDGMLEACEVGGMAGSIHGGGGRAGEETVYMDYNVVVAWTDE
mgnify:CR=1 FL=1